MNPKGSPPAQQRQMIFRSALQYYLNDCSPLPGKLIDILIIILNLAVCAMVVIETYPVAAGMRDFMWLTEIAIVVVFMIEYAARLCGCRKRDIIRTDCDLRYHDDVASHCQSCGPIIYQEYDGV